MMISMRIIKDADDRDRKCKGRTFVNFEHCHVAKDSLPPSNVFLQKLRYIIITISVLITITATISLITTTIITISAMTVEFQ